ncbi:UNKNOWN [Stylonychia lemnae]|uniref:Uncharacterized protein n=1 Tax=Stylonychia lemnae TaxID=5949 RepID=A0A078ANK6_STYLE|nr:UNKNOWN [Stylonychia lemnae]|eukprot:CDW83925.1 UNKNOWN [Stylonychia lemnae]
MFVCMVFCNKFIQVTANSCPYTTYPMILGGINDETVFKSFDLTSDGLNIVVGGYTKDKEILQLQQNQQQPIIGYIMQGLQSQSNLYQILTIYLWTTAYISLQLNYIGHPLAFHTYDLGNAYVGGYLASGGVLVANIIDYRISQLIGYILATPLQQMAQNINVSQFWRCLCSQFLQAQKYQCLQTMENASISKEDQPQHLRQYIPCKIHQSYIIYQQTLQIMLQLPKKQLCFHNLHLKFMKVIITQHKVIY